ncbi:DUF3139 domain-containing protein [Bacillus smithii]|uniref:DUF3139 domain-containing protein n=1 Tax=Bacillus smithii TaxID=1479 RepID=UPI002E220383|nr:DUF3139 domain-containing protein [Bacillus smithii]MED1457635.1 DUF3139 domain-containing protein [Bacillus smithii]MED1488817.1 DUF3139 domain-containing protein [Bacillus smithii]
MKSKKMKGLMLVLLILIGGGFLTDKFYFQKAAAQKTIMDHIEEKGYADQIESKKMVYDSKKGTYYMVVYYKDEKGVRYEYFCNGGLIPTKVFVAAYDHHDSIEKGTKGKGKYLEE